MPDPGGFVQDRLSCRSTGIGSGSWMDPAYICKLSRLSDKFRQDSRDACEGLGEGRDACEGLGEDE
jgi:hypothetical protein